MGTQSELSSLVVGDLQHSHLGHAARDKRLQQLGDGLARAPAQSFPQVFKEWAALKGAYRFFGNACVEPAAILSGHVGCTAARCRLEAFVLLVQDTTSLTLTREVAGAGPVGPHGVQGLFVHTCLAVTGAEGHGVLGVLVQEAWAREGRRRKRKETGRKRKARACRESGRWADVALQASSQLGEAPGRPLRVLHVFDREGDVFEALEMLDTLQDSFVVRAVRNRRLQTRDGAADYVEDAVARAPVLGTYALHVPPGPARTGREALLQVRACSVLLLPPLNRQRAGAALAVNVVLAEEVLPPEGEAPVRWLLLTREPVASLEGCLAVVHAYTARWRIEEFHMGLKTGCALERRELHEAQRVLRLLALCSVLAWGLLALRDAARASPSPPAAQLLNDVQLQLLSQLRPKLPAHPSAYEALRALATLGGFIGRAGDGEPGWRTLWRGMQELLTAELGYRLALASRSPSPSG